jgi:ABC-type glutathione transport system ATPase component
MPSDKQKFIRIKGARQHNLKNLDVRIPRHKLVVVTGLSGSGKSSLAFDTLFAEGQRKYVESLSAYARQFLDQMQKPDVDYIEGLSPAIEIRESPDYELHTLCQRDPAILETVGEKHRQQIEAECATLSAEAEELAKQVEELTGEASPGTVDFQA